MPSPVAERDSATSVLGRLLVQPLQARDPAQVREHPHLVGGVAAAPVRVERRHDAVPRRGPVGCRDRRQRALEQHPVQAEEVAGPPGERLQLLEDVAQPGDLAEVGVGGLEAVQADDQRGVLARGATGRGGAESVVERLRERQPVCGEHREAGQRVGLGRPVAEDSRDPRQGAAVGRTPPRRSAPTTASRPARQLGHLRNGGPRLARAASAAWWSGASA